MGKESKPATDLATITDRTAALVTVESPQTDAFAKYSEDRELWFATPSAHNLSLAMIGAPFTVVLAAEIIMAASDLDKENGIQEGEGVPKIAYLCKAQMDFQHRDPMDKTKDRDYPRGAAFKIFLAPNAGRRAELERIQEYLTKGPIYNVCLKANPTKKVGHSPSVSLVAADQWKSLRDE